MIIKGCYFPEIALKQAREAHNKACEQLAQGIAAIPIMEI
jgi:hypothetical protein